MKTFIPRYWSAVPLAWLILRYGRSLPFNIHTN